MKFGIDFKIMSKEEIKKQLIDLQKEMKDYAEYLEKYTYHPYDKIEKYSYMLKDIIKNFDD